MFWDIFDIPVFHVAQNMWDFHATPCQYSAFLLCLPYYKSLEAYKMITIEEIVKAISLESLWFEAGKADSL